MSWPSRTEHEHTLGAQQEIVMIKNKERHPSWRVSGLVMAQYVTAYQPDFYWTICESDPDLHNQSINRKGVIFTPPAQTFSTEEASWLAR